MTFVAAGATVAAAGISAGSSAASSASQSDSAKAALDWQKQQFAETKAALNKGNKQAQGYSY